MYADRMEGGARRPVKERLNNGNGVIGSTRQQQQRQITGKRSRQDDKWEHDLFDNDKPQITNCKVSAPDLRLKLQRKGLQLAAQSGKSSAPNMRDLHERLSGTMSPQLTNADQPKTKVVKSSSKSVGVEAPAVQIKRPADLTPKKSQKAGSSVDEFLRSLCLEKYLITFQAEEVDMTALNHMTDEDLKAMGIPMGPRKKILLALESKTLIK
ncbi:Phospholipase DDHD2 [Glycine max]|nr:Phospholipase DDHD2 [Glycine max]